MTTEQQEMIKQIHAQASNLAVWAEKLLEVSNPKKKKGLSEAEINKALTKRRKVKTTIKP